MEFRDPTPEEEQERRNQSTLREPKFGERLRPLLTMSRMYHMLCFSREVHPIINNDEVAMGQWALESWFIETLDSAITSDEDNFPYTHRAIEALISRNTSYDRLLAEHMLYIEQYLCMHSSQDRRTLPVPPAEAADQWRRLLGAEPEERIQRGIGYRLDATRQELYRQESLTPELAELAVELDRVAEEFPYFAGRPADVTGNDPAAHHRSTLPEGEELILYPG